MHQFMAAITENVQSFILSSILSERFVEVRTSLLPAEWTVSDPQVRERARNYSEDLKKTYRLVGFLSILGTVHTQYVQHDIKQAMKEAEGKYRNIDRLIREAIANNDVKNLLRAYTLDGPFFKILNHHLAIVISADNAQRIKMTKQVNMRYWQGPLDIAAIFLCHPALEHLRFRQGIVYRGMLIGDEEDLRPFQVVGNRVLNKTFVSTSKNPTMAMTYAGTAPGDQPSAKSCLFKYTMRENARRTALDIHSLSQFPEEEEVLILPYANFKVISYQRSPLNANLTEIELEECAVE